jgi:hypothetical protein
MIQCSGLDLSVRDWRVPLFFSFCLIHWRVPVGYRNKHLPYLSARIGRLCVTGGF